MSAPNDGGPAFPRPVAHADKRYRTDQPMYCEPQSGMSLRDWFAGQALAGLLGDHLTLASVKITALQNQGDQNPHQIMAEWAYDHADAMIKARNAADGSETK